MTGEINAGNILDSLLKNECWPFDGILHCCAVSRLGSHAHDWITSFTNTCFQINRQLRRRA